MAGGRNGLGESDHTTQRDRAGRLSHKHGDRQRGYGRPMLVPLWAAKRLLRRTTPDTGTTRLCGLWAILRQSFL